MIAVLLFRMAFWNASKYFSLSGGFVCSVVLCVRCSHEASEEDETQFVVLIKDLV